MTNDEQDLEKFRAFQPAVVALVVASVLLRTGLSMTLPRTIKFDEPAYLLLGYNLLAGNGFTYTGYPELHYSPLYPVIAGLFYLVTGDFATASNLVYALCGGLLLFPIFAMARRIYGVKTAWLATVLMAVFPALTVNVLYWGTLTEPLYLFLLYGGLVLLLRGLENGRFGIFAGAGAFLGLAYLTRPEAVVYVVVFVIFAWIWLWKGVKCGIAKTWCVLGSFALPFVLLAVPYIWYLHVHTGHWMVSGKLAVVWEQASNSEQMVFDRLTGRGEIAWVAPDRFQTNMVHTVLTDPGGILRRVIKNGRIFKDQFFNRFSFWWGLTPLVVLALFNQPWDPRRARYEAFLITTVFVVMLTFLPFFFRERMFAPTYPVLLIWTARGALQLGCWLQNTVAAWHKQSIHNRYLKLALGWLPAGMVLGFMILNIPLSAQASIASTVFGEKEAGLWLKAHTPAESKVLTKELGVALYADRRWVPWPNTGWSHFLQYARAHRVSYLVVPDVTLKYWPEIANALQKGTPELQLVASFEESRMPRQVRTLVYRFSDLR